VVIVLKITLEAMAWAIGFGFQEGQVRPKPTPGQHFWLGLAWLGFWPEAKPCTSLILGQSPHFFLCYFCLDVIVLYKITNMKFSRFPIA
jgi:hypothetical protein